MSIEYFLPDSRDAIDTQYDFTRECTSPDRVTRDDVYCHEVLPRPYDGILLSYTALEKGRYSAAARRRLLRSGASAFFRAPQWLRFMGDCGAFSYFKEKHPPYSVQTIVSYYETIGAHLGLAVDHIVPGYSATTLGANAVTALMRERFEMTLDLAAQFLSESKGKKFEPVGVVQGWDPRSYCVAAKRLQSMGYTYIALGGIVRLTTPKLLSLLEALGSVSKAGTRLHLLGVARSTHVDNFAAHGVSSLDSTSPLRRAWMDKRKNYWLGAEHFAAIRIPPSNSSRICKRLAAGELDGDSTRKLESAALDSMAAYARKKATFEDTLEALLAYQRVHSPDDDRKADYTRTLQARPWEKCPCTLCKKLGYHVILLRGAERNRRRGFHNVGTFYKNFSRAQAKPDVVLVSCGRSKLDHPAQADRLYTGSLFRAHMRLAEKYRAPILIMSAKHGLLSPLEVVTPYDLSLSSMSCQARQRWGARIVRALKKRIPDIRHAVVLAGSRYTEWQTDCGFTVDDPLHGLTLGARLAKAYSAD